MMPHSLSMRLLLASLVVLPLFLGASGYMLDSAFHRSLYAAESERLKTHIYLLLGAAEVEAGKLWFPEQLAEPRFSQLGSGLYGWVGNNKQQTLWRSDSAQLLLAQEVKIGQVPVKVGTEKFYSLTLGGENLFVYYYDVSWDTDQQTTQHLRFATLHSQDSLRAELAEYRRQLWQWLGALAILLLATQSFILRWGLQPLRRLAKDLTAVESGQTQQLQGQYPREIQPVTDNLNLVLRNEQTQRERYRNTLADLAHSLKTPLAVIRGCITNNKVTLDQTTLSEQIDRMDQIVSHQLQRATLNTKTLTAHTTNLGPVVQRLNQALDKVYSDKHIAFSADIDPQAQFQGDERDLMEVLGNLLENAYKYGKSQVVCTATQQGSQLAIHIEDDGTGISETNRQTILQRGARADTATSGQGIGLAVAVDIVSSYNGSIAIKKSALGGASFRVVLPGLNVTLGSPQ